MSDQSPRPAKALESRSPESKEPCISCGEETATGSVFFSDRRTVDHVDGSRTYLCTLCDGRIRSQRKGKRLTDDEVRSFVETGSLAMITWERF